MDSRGSIDLGELRNSEPGAYAEACELCGFSTFEEYAKYLNVGRPVPGAEEKAREDYEQSGEEPPTDDTPFDVSTVPAYADGDWPPSYRLLMCENMPRDVTEKCGGNMYETVFNGTFMEFPSDAADCLLEALRDLGHTCIEDHELIELVATARE